MNPIKKIRNILFEKPPDPPPKLPVEQRPTDDQMVMVVKQWVSEAENKEEFLATRYDDLVDYHQFFGMRIRNHFNLWQYPWEPKMQNHGGCEVDASEDHPDAISMRVIRRAWKELQKEGNSQ